MMKTGIFEHHLEEWSDTERDALMLRYVLWSVQ